MLKLLPPVTEAAWNVLRGRPELGGFVLVGGTALTLHIHHRLSEDLDFAWREARLPTHRLELAIRVAESVGLACRRYDDPGAVAEFADSGLELRDYQQDFLIGGVKVSFFAADSHVSAVLGAEVADVPRVATVDELFRLKCLVSARRSRTRDWFDLYVLLREHGYTLGTAAINGQFCGRVAPGSYPPGLPQIRTCAINASGSSAHGFAA